MKQQLAELARLYGIQTSYIDMRKQKREADPEALLRVLKAMGAPEDPEKALRQRRKELSRRRVEPVVVAWDGKLAGWKKLPIGYHELKIKGQETFVISAPKKAFFPNGAGKAGRSPVSRASRPSSRMWGLFVPVYALHSERSPNIGDLSDLESVLDWMGGLGGQVVATLPLLAQFLDVPFEPSPYSPASRLFWNELYVDVARLPEFEASRRVRHLLSRRPPATELIDYRAEMACKRKALEAAAAAFAESGSPERRKSFKVFLRDNRQAEDYARFRAVTDRLGMGWNTWPPRMRDGRLHKDDYDDATKNYHLYAQWVVEEQLEALYRKASASGQLLYLDLPLGLHPDSYDVWRNRNIFVSGMSGGAPPDIVFTKGQNWGFPPMNPEAMRVNKHQYTIAYIRNHLRFSRLLRVDHVMGLHRLFWIPDGMDGDKGVYVEYPAEELWAILSVESHRHQAGVVGENLGTVPPEVNSSMLRHNVQEMYVVQYEIAGEPHKDTLRPVPGNCVASVNTHDMPPFQAFLDGTDIDDRVDLAFLDKKAAVEVRRERRVLKGLLKGFLGRNTSGLFPAVAEWLAESMANVVLINAEDLWKEVLPQNVPATWQERPNWSRRLRPSIEEMRRIPSVIRILTNVSAKRSRSLPVQ